MAKLHIIGDSHIRSFFSITNRDTKPFSEMVGDIMIIDEICGRYAGMTMTGLSDSTCTSQERGFLSDLRNYLQSQQFDSIGLVFGEVDIRWHVHLEVRDGHDLTSMLSNRLAIYESFIKNEVVPRVTGHIVVFGGIPYSKRYCDSVNYSDGKLNTYVKRFDELIGEMCKRNGWHHLSVYDDFVQGGFLPQPYVNIENECSVHLEPSMTHNVVFEKLGNIFAE